MKKGWKYDSDHIAASEDDDKEDEEGGDLLLPFLPRSLLLIVSDLSRFLGDDILKICHSWSAHET